jgi:hypothetical protein
MGMLLLRDETNSLTKVHGVIKNGDYKRMLKKIIVGLGGQKWEQREKQQ